MQHGHSEGRTKAYRLLQYASKALQLVLRRVFHVNSDSSESIRVLKVLEYLMGTCRKAMRLFRFLDMWTLFPTVVDKNPSVRRLRQTRILAFLCMFLFENISLFYPTTDVTVDDGQGKRRTLVTVRWSRWCHTCWFVSLVLGVGLDLHLHRPTSRLAMLKNLTDLPIALLLALRIRVDDALMCGLSLSSSVMGMQLHWTGRALHSNVKPFESVE
ncbi:hypothetical protein B5M09_009956 [Aphanomyces astaci]|uniref:Uncharacterized protein n=1 Tax=Aphanomyces astaci TaxID=112090 RepID=A0A3R7WJ76_APHAT|nr:hypothetical protein B5M09_009956 [Aphanomyces astaci]